MRQVQSRTLTVLACLMVWLALVIPSEISRVTFGTFVRIPLEGLAVVALALILRPREGRAIAAPAGVLLGLVVIVKLLDMGFFAVLDRPFDLMTDWSYLGRAVGVLGHSIGRTGAAAAVVGATLLAVAVLVLMPLAVMRLGRLVTRHRKPSIRAVTALAIIWVLCAVAGLQITPVGGVASASAARLAYDQVSNLRGDIRDRQAFAKAIAGDPFDEAAGKQMLTGLRGKDVLVVFVESYGRVAVADPEISPQVNALLEAGTNRLQAAGFSSRSAFLTSPTFGAASWLAHATLQSGLWVDSQQRYNQLLTQDRLTLTGAFERAGWRTAFVLPADHHDWPLGSSFYNFDTLYDARNLGYRGPDFGYIPDQYTLSAFQRLELAKTSRIPVMAQIDLISSHYPWTPVPPMVDWGRIGDGSFFDCMPECAETSGAGVREPKKVRDLYRESIGYTLRTIISFVETHPDDDLVLVVVGDHQPHSYVTGEGVSHDVPITIIAHDPAVLRQISEWGWQAGMKPGPGAPVWRMDAFRNRFLTAFGS